MSSFTFPLTDMERRARNHAVLCTTGFLILLPVGVLVARYIRTFTNRWWTAHWIIQFLISGPVIFAGWALGYKTTAELQQGHFQDHHEKIGLSLLCLYLAQILLGVIVHFLKFPSTFKGRAPHNYIHILLGLAIIALAQYQVHYGLFSEWPIATGGLHQVPSSAKNAWLALLVIFWVLYAVGLGFIPRQFRQEKQPKKTSENHPASINNKLP